MFHVPGITHTLYDGSCSWGRIDDFEQLLVDEGPRRLVRLRDKIDQRDVQLGHQTHKPTDKPRSEPVVSHNKPVVEHNKPVVDHEYREERRSGHGLRREQHPPEVKHDPQPSVKHELQPPVKHQPQPPVKHDPLPEVPEPVHKPQVKHDPLPEVPEPVHKPQVKHDPLPEVPEPAHRPTPPKRSYDIEGYDQQGYVL